LVLALLAARPGSGLIVILLIVVAWLLLETSFAWIAPDRKATSQDALSFSRVRLEPA
jgi:hypothetical protein